MINFMLSTIVCCLLHALSLNVLNFNFSFSLLNIEGLSLLGWLDLAGIVRM